LLDIDHFKGVNDTYGHVVGDIVLKELTGRIGSCLQRATDWRARLGGEEFAVVLEGTTLTDARACAEKVRSVIANTAIETAVGTIRVTVSIGVSGLESFPDRRSASVEAVLQHADTNLYASKAAGRNRVTLSVCNGTHAPAREPAIQRGDYVHTKVSLSSVR
jgi:diguanylate cyclase (GGDEF)-like protein